MEDLFERIAACVELGKINQVSPYPPAMKGQPGAEELTVQALKENVSPSDILTKGLIWEWKESVSSLRKTRCLFLRY